MFLREGGGGAVQTRLGMGDQLDGDRRHQIAEPSLGDEALAKAGVDRCTYGFSDSTMSIWKTIFEDDAYQLPVFRPLHRGLLRLPAYAKETESALAAALDGEQAVSESILHAAVHGWYEGHIQGEDECPGCDFRGRIPKGGERG